MNYKKIIFIYIIILSSCSRSIDFQREGYSGIYSNHHRQSKTICYFLTRECVCGSEKRTNVFYEDSIVSDSLLPKYKGSGYDRGHLKPADHSRCSESEMKESFLTLNISPQIPSFNRGPWKQLEAYSKRSLNFTDSVLVYCGPIFGPIWRRSKHKGLIIPQAYYRTLKLNDSTFLGFILDQSEKKFDPFRHVVPINIIERKTRLDLYPGTPEIYEDKVDINVLKELNQLSFLGICG